MATKIPLLSFQTSIFLLLFTFSFHVYSQTNFNNQEQTILLKIKDFWLNPSSLSHWTNSSNPCKWPGITCTNNSVTAIRVVNQNITQPIPPSICDLKNLAVLDLNDNEIPGTFPTALYNCANLQYLDLSDNYFTGLIPDDIDRLSTRLEFLNLADNNFTGDIPVAIGRLSGLKELKLYGNLFNGTFPKEIGNLVNLQVLVLNNNGFVPQAIPSSFMGLKNLKNLFMEETNLIGEIPQDIGNLTALEFLDLSTNRLSGNIPPGTRNPNKLSQHFVALISSIAAIAFLLAFIYAFFLIRKLMCCLSTDNSNEYMENRSLDLWLHSKKKKTTISGSVNHVVLDWPKRLPIAVAAASGLCYMHHDSHTPICKKKSQWQKGKLIGRGTFGSVYVASNKETGALCAMKEVEILPDDPKSAECIRQLEQEIKVLSNLQHPNIVQYYGSERAGDRFYIYLEYVHPGSINRFIHDHCGAITESVVRNFTRHILCGLAYLHSTKTIHRDIKGANLLVDAYGVVKLADFGMAKHLNGHAANLSLKGSPYWMAPELLQADLHKDDSTNHALAVDIWSLGCTIIEMVNGKPPWSEYEGPAAMFKVLKETPPIPENLSAEGKDFLNCCFRRNPAERPTASMLLEHCFVKNQHPQDVISSCQSFGGMKSTINANTED